MFSFIHCGDAPTNAQFPFPPISEEHIPHPPPAAAEPALMSPALLAQFSSNAPSAVIDISPSQPTPAFAKPAL